MHESVPYLQLPQSNHDGHGMCKTNNGGSVDGANCDGEIDKLDDVTREGSIAVVGVAEEEIVADEQEGEEEEEEEIGAASCKVREDGITEGDDIHGPED